MRSPTIMWTGRLRNPRWPDAPTRRGESGMLRGVLADRERRMRQGPSPWAAVARFGQASWFFGNLYEAVVDVP